MLPVDAYCGPAPPPEALAASWNADPAVIALLAVLVALAVRQGRADRGLAALVLAIAFVSPLCALSSALFSARAVHHLMMVALAAPMLMGGIVLHSKSLKVDIKRLNPLSGLQRMLVVAVQGGQTSSESCRRICNQHPYH